MLDWLSVEAEADWLVTDWRRHGRAREMHSKRKSAPKDTATLTCFVELLFTSCSNASKNVSFEISGLLWYKLELLYEVTTGLTGFIGIV
jgi:hypothetical protein